MKRLHEILSAYFAEHPADMGMTDAESVLGFLYSAYCEARETDPPGTKALFADLGEYLEKLPLSTNNAMFFIIVKLCTEHERQAFEEGIRWGFQLHCELLKKEKT